MGSSLRLTFAINQTAKRRLDPARIKTESVAIVDSSGAGTELTTRLDYDPNGNVNQITDPLQRVTGFAHNYRGKVTGRTDALGSSTSFAYGASGCPSCGGDAEKLISVTDPAGAATVFSYDRRGLLTAKTDPLHKSTTYAYNAVGRLTSKTDRKNRTVSFQYDNTGNPVQITYPGGSTVVNTFDALDRLSTTQDSLGTTSYTYDAAGRVLSVSNPDGFGLSYVYDAAGNLTQMTYPDGSTVDYTYDASNRLTTVTFGADTASYAYDAPGKLTSFTHFNGVETTYTYDTANRLIGVSSSVASYAFTLDAAGNRTHVLRNEPLECQLAQGSTVYEYNALKNRLQSAGTTAYAYDDEGQLTAAGTTALAFDDAHRLIGIGSGTQFTYDWAGKRLKAVRSGVETRYIYDPFGNLMAEADATGQISRKYIYGAGLLAMETAASGTFFYHFDATGHTIALTDLDQNIVNAYAYEPFGQILNQQETIAQPFKFVGKFGVMAEDGGLYYMRARYYDSSTGRFISEDPIGFAGGDVNLSAYVHNSPIMFADPLGLLEDSVANLARRQSIANTATGYQGSHNFDVSAYGNSQYPKNSYKCSYFVCAVLKEAGAPISVKPKGGSSRCATAGELANKNWNPKDWRQLKPGEPPLPGDIAGYPLTPNPGSPMMYTGHPGIMVGGGEGIAAHDTGVYVEPGQFSPSVNGIVFRRYIGE